MRRLLTLLIPVLLTAACASSGTLASASSTSSASASAARSPLPAASSSPLPVGSPVAARILAPATVMPVVGLCSAVLEHTADGNAWPLLCRGGRVNVLAWAFYAQLLPHTLAAGRQATLADVWAAMCHEGNATNVELEYGFDIAAAYYGWTFSFDPTAIRC